MRGVAVRGAQLTLVAVTLLLVGATGAQARSCGWVKDNSGRLWSVVRDGSHRTPTCPTAKRTALRMIRTGTGTPGWKCTARDGGRNGRCVRGRRESNGLISREHWVFWYLQPDAGPGENY